MTTFKELYAQTVGSLTDYGVRWSDEATGLILAREWGCVLIRYTNDPFGHNYWIWTSGGGSSSLAKTDAEALVLFAQKVAWIRDYWAKTIGSGSIIVDRVHYRDGGAVDLSKRTQPAFLGFGGAVWGIEDLKTGRRWSTNNLWHQGDLPPEITLTDTHRFLPPDECDDPKISSNLTNHPSVEQSSIINR